MAAEFLVSQFAFNVLFSFCVHLLCRLVRFSRITNLLKTSLPFNQICTRRVDLFLLKVEPIRLYSVLLRNHKVVL